MGKVRKWSINFLLGRKKEKNKKEKTDFPEENVNDLPVKRRWSFGRSPSKGKSSKGFLKSLESNPVAENGIVGFGNPKNDILAFGEATYAKTGTAFVRNEASTTLEDAAATRIQAVFRSYLARKALCALRALVKLQALVRGHLVRKQTSTILRQMHALMAIQVRARFHRIQMAEESQFVGRSQSSRYRNIPLDKGIRRIHSHREASDTRIEHGVTVYYYPGNLSISKLKHQYLEELSFSPPYNTPQRYYCSISKKIPGGASLSCEQRSYKAKTKSSAAKVRPKQQHNGRVTADEE